MVKYLNSEMLKTIVDEANSGIYIYQKEKEKDMKERQWMYETDGSMLVTFLTGIAEVKPGEPDILNREWHPKIKDKDGNPLISEKDGKPKKAWTKYEAKVLVKGKEKVYGLGGEKSVQLQAIVSEMVKHEIDNEKLSGTKWKIKCIDAKKFLWDVEYLETVDLKENATNEGGKAKVDVYQSVKEAVIGVKKDNQARALIGIEKDMVVNAVAFKTNLSEKQVGSVWQKLIDEHVIREENGKVFFN